jgi:cytochrome c2
MRKMVVLSAMMIGLMVLPSGAARAAAKAKAKAEPAKAAAPAKAEPAPEQAQQAAEAPLVGNAEAGRKIYESICFHCHRLDYDASEVGAPGLRDVTHRHDVAWIEQWITSPRAFAKVDPSAKALVASNPYGLTMPTLPEMQDPQNRADIIAFLKTLEDKDTKKQ